MPDGEVSVRELRNHTSAVLRRVEAGRRIRVTVDRRPVAELVPLERHPRWVPGEIARSKLEPARADPALRGDLIEALGQTTDEL